MAVHYNTGYTVLLLARFTDNRQQIGLLLLLQKWLRES